MTTGLLLALREAGMNIPEDVSLISFDDLPYFSLLQHPLTAISQPMYELGNRACELLLGLIDTSGPPNAEFGLRLPANLIARESCAAPRDE